MPESKRFLLSNRGRHMVLCKSASTSLCVLHLLSPLPPVPSRLASAFEKAQSRGRTARGGQRRESRLLHVPPASLLAEPSSAQVRRAALAAPRRSHPCGWTTARRRHQSSPSPLLRSPPVNLRRRVSPPISSGAPFVVPQPQPCSAIESSSAAAESTSDARRRAARASEQLLRTAASSSCRVPPPRLQAPLTSRCAQARAHARCRAARADGGARRP
jgi:hypothetical protein